MDRLPNDLSVELAEMRARLAALESEQTSARRRVRWGGAAAVVAALVGTAASAANGACPNGLPFCFSVDTPALASEVNTNFMQLKEWLESKVGAVGSAVKIPPGAAVTTLLTPPTNATRALFVSANTGSNIDPIVDFRHDNLTQGVGIGWSSVVATGTVTNQDLYLVAKGTGQVISTSNFNVGASATSCATGPCYCPVGFYPLSWTGTCNGAGVGVYSVTAVTLGSQRGIDVQCINSAFNGFGAMRSMVVTCSRLVTQ